MYSGVAYFGGAQGVSPLELVNLAKTYYKLPIFNNCGAHFSVGNFVYWASLIYWVGKIIY